MAGYEQVFGNSVTIIGATPGGLSIATCPVGKKILGGGWLTTGAGVLVPELTALHNGGSGRDWNVQLNRTASSPAGGFLTFSAFAICAVVS